VILHHRRSVVQSEPSATSDLKVIGDKRGYASKEAADKALKASAKGQCKNVFRGGQQIQWL
jgi:hypothetical protein